MRFNEADRPMGLNPGLTLFFSVSFDEVSNADETLEFLRQDLPLVE